MSVNKKVMLLKFIIQRLPVRNQANLMKRRGIVVGTRNKNGRRSYLYMINNLFAEILYENDNPGLEVETLVLLDGLKSLQTYFRNDVR